MGYIQAIGTAVPPHHLTQEQFSEVYGNLAQSSEIRRKIKFLTAKSAINKRHCIDTDIARLVHLSLDEKLEEYHYEAVNLGYNAIKNNQANEQHKDELTDLITVSCTGMQAPGIEIDLIQKLGLPSDIRRYNINFMGCYASITALRLAKEICSSPGRKVLIVSVELCTLHFQQKFSEDYLLSNSLFADGAASVLVTSEKYSSTVKLIDFESRIIPNSKGEMSWKISPDGFLMTLSSQVPCALKSSLDAKTLFQRNPNQVNWAIHPGGKQIVDGLATTLRLSESDVLHSRAVLREFGNMSSATVLFVLSQMITDQSPKEEIISCAFGPGLTLEACLLQYV